MKYIIIGGVVGGATTAARLRRLDEHSEIIIFERGEYISYANCGLPYYIGGTITERDNLFVQTPGSFGKRFNLEVMGIRKEEFVDGVLLGGVATYLEKTEDAGLNLFV